MARMNFGYLPHENPCAQCGKPIATPEWIENGPRRSYAGITLVRIHQPNRRG
jgi:hypothetical protein